MPQPANVEEVKCVQCGRVFKRKTRKRGGGIGLNVRRSNCITCSSKCSKDRRHEYDKNKFNSQSD